MGTNMLKKIGLTAVFLAFATQASALCIVNRSSETVAYTRGGPFIGMETLFAGTIRPGVQHCTSITPRSDGTYPVSVYTIGKRGKCNVVRGCLYESLAEQIFFGGAGSATCPVSFQDNSCS